MHFERSLRPLAALFALLAAGAPVRAQVQIPKIFGDNMVLQRGRPVPIWGTAKPGARVSVAFAGQSQEVVADQSGRWKAAIGPLRASAEGRDLVVTGGNRIVCKNVLVGEVWVCSGQSNMEWTVNGSKNAAEEKKTAKYAGIRHIKVSRRPSDSPQSDFNGNWSVCSPESVGSFTAVGYYFARELHRQLEVPIGLVNTSWGGTRIEPWIPLIGFHHIQNANFAGPIIRTIENADPTTPAGKKQYAEALGRFKQWMADAEARVAEGAYPTPAPKMPSLGGNHQSPARLYRGMVHPLVPFAMRGAIWYQGESNGNEDQSYYHKMHGLVGGWRRAWGQGDFPFYHVQLANFTQDRNTPQGGDGYAKIRDAQRRSLDIANTGMAVIIDIGETRDIHPRNKQDVGKRLAQWALARDYGKDIVPSGPLYKSHSVERGAIRIRFDNVGKGLMIGKKEGLEPTTPNPDAKLRRFAVAGADKKWAWADAKIDGDSVVVSSEAVAKPVAVRYAFSANPLGANLYNRDGLPASPFRTDKW